MAIEAGVLQDLEAQLHPHFDDVHFQVVAGVPQVVEYVPKVVQDQHHEEQKERQIQHCPGRKPAFLVSKRPARPYKSPTQNRFTWENANGA
jgi:hypothetical protein